MQGKRIQRPAGQTNILRQPRFPGWTWEDSRRLSGYDASEVQYSITREGWFERFAGVAAHKCRC